MKRARTIVRACKVCVRLAVFSVFALAAGCVLGYLIVGVLGLTYD